MFCQIEGLYHIPRSVPVEKQNWGERRGNPGGCDIMGFGFLGPPTAPAVGAAPFHKMSASMWGGKGREGNSTRVEDLLAVTRLCGLCSSQGVTAGIAKLRGVDGVT